MSDSISRQAAIDEIRKCRFVVDAIEKIRALPPAQPDITEKQIAEYCRKRNLVLITQESFETLKAYYDRQNSV